MAKRSLLLCLIFGMAMMLCACHFSGAPPLPPTPTAVPTPPPLPGHITLLSFSENASYVERVSGFEFCLSEGEPTAYFYLANEDEPYAVAVDQDWVDQLTQIVHQYDLAAWDGFHENAEGLLDGTFFSFQMTFSNGAAVNAHGYGAFPRGYGDATSLLDSHFMKLLPEDLRDW